MTASAQHLAERALARRAAAGAPLRLWLRDDDAVAPTPALDRLLGFAAEARIPLTLAVIPAPWDQPPTGPALARRLEAEPDATVVLHGWSHRNHAPAGVKKQELGPHRPLCTIRAELRTGLERLRQWHGARALPMLVPPWNRIAPELLPFLAEDGFTALSTFGPEKPTEGLRVLNTHLDMIDWHGSRSLRPRDTLWMELAALADSGQDTAGVLTHHLAHDAEIWSFLTELAGTVAAGHGEWCALRALIPAAPAQSA